MNKRIIEKVKAYIEKYQMIAPGDTVVAGVSGGADSVCLLLLLHELSKVQELRILAVHINHGIRPEGAKDAAYVERLCAELGLPFFLVQEQVGTIAKEQGISEEEAGRIVRYHAFETILDENCSGGNGKIATAHNAGDRAETMLFHLFRGTGLAGMGGIKPCRDRVVRPLLCLERWEIEDYLQKKQVNYCMDATNSEDNYTRNRIRHHILPYAEREISQAAVRHMCSAADVLLETEAYVRKQTGKLAEECMERQHEKLIIRTNLLLAQEPFMQKQLLLWALEVVTDCRKDIGSVHINDMIALLGKSGSKELMLPHGILVRKEYGSLVIEKWKKNTEKEKDAASAVSLLVPGSVYVKSLGTVKASAFLYKKSQIIPEKACTKWFDYDRITKSLEFRTRQSGDYLTVNAGMSRKKVKDYMIDEKIPKNVRDQLWLLAEGSHIIWIPGYRISQYYKVTEDTRNILEVRLQEDITWQKQ